MPARPLIDENRILPISLKVLLLIMGVIIGSVTFGVVTNSRLDEHSSQIQALQQQQKNFNAEQQKQGDILNYLLYLTKEMAKKQGVDTSNPLDQNSSIKNLNTDIYLPL